MAPSEELGLLNIRRVGGPSTSHRKAWIIDRLRALTGHFGVEVCGYAIMSNHLYLVLRNRPDSVEHWSDAGVALRWRKLFSKEVTIRFDGPVYRRTCRFPCPVCTLDMQHTNDPATQIQQITIWSETIDNLNQDLQTLATELQVNLVELRESRMEVKRLGFRSWTVCRTRPEPL